MGHSGCSCGRVQRCVQLWDSPRRSGAVSNCGRHELKTSFSITGTK